MDFIHLIYFACIGLVLISFLTATISRHIKHSPQTNFSYCDHCYTRLSYREMIPVFSYIIQRGKCRHCHLPLPPEIIFGESSTLIWIYFSLFRPINDTVNTYVFLFGFFLIIASIYDLIHQSIPDRYWFFCFILTLPLKPLFHQWLLALGIAIIYIIISLLFPPLIGGADVKALSVISLVLPFHLFSIFCLIASGSALLYQLYHYWRHHSLIERIPFIPFITIAFFIASFFNN